MATARRRLAFCLAFASQGDCRCCPNSFQTSRSATHRIGSSWAASSIAPPSSEKASRSGSSSTCKKPSASLAMGNQVAIGRSLTFFDAFGDHLDGIDLRHSHRPLYAGRTIQIDCTSTVINALVRAAAICIIDGKSALDQIWLCYKNASSTNHAHIVNAVSFLSSSFLNSEIRSAST